MRDNPRKTKRQMCLDDLKAALCRFAQQFHLDNPELQAQIIRNRILHAIEDHRNKIASERHYDGFVSANEENRSLPEWLLRYQVRLVNDRRRNGSIFSGRKLSIEDAVAVQKGKPLTPVERRAIELLKGRRAHDHPIDRQAAMLVATVAGRRVLGYGSRDNGWRARHGAWAP